MADGTIKEAIEEIKLVQIAITEREILAQETMMKIIAAWGVGYTVQQAAPILLDAVKDGFLVLENDGKTLVAAHNAKAAADAPPQT